MNKYDEIFKMLNCVNTQAEQKKGIELAKKTNNIELFFQPYDLEKKIGQNVWENCAIIISSYSDLDLFEHLDKMFEWLQDLNWPGFNIILQRLKIYDKNLLSKKLDDQIDLLIKQNEYEWLSNISELIFDNEKKIHIQLLIHNYFEKCEKRQIEAILNEKEKFINQLGDDELRPIALIALSKLKDEKLRKYFEKYENHSDSTIRLIAKQAIMAIDSEN